MNGVRRFRVRVGTTDHAVEVRTHRNGGGDGRTTATIDGVLYETIVGADGRVLVREHGATTHRVVTFEPAAVPRFAAADGETFELEVLTAQQAALADARRAAKSGSSSMALRSPMPGRIVRVLVAEGDVVDTESPTVIVEAMKMENEVRATGPGRVQKVAVAVGDTVDAGQVLCELVPHPAAS